MKPVKCLVFDAYGTLFDVHSIVTALDRRFPGQGAAVSEAWRTRQLEYTWLRSMMDQYEDFWKVTESALIATCNALKLPLEAGTRAALMEGYLRLDPFPEVKQTLSALPRVPLAILSNGNPKMLDEVVRNAGLEGVFSHVISVDEVKTYKPSAATYKLAVKKMGMEADGIGFVSSNFFDVAGAKVFGFRSHWLNRSGAPAEELGVTPDATLKSLSELAKLVKPQPPKSSEGVGADGRQPPRRHQAKTSSAPSNAPRRSVPVSSLLEQNNQRQIFAALMAAGIKSRQHQS